MKFTRQGSKHSSAPTVVIIGTIAVALAWLLTPKYSPWLCHAALGSVSLAAAFYFGSIDHTANWTKGAGLSGVVLGLILAIMSWIGAPIAARLVPSFGTELRQLYGILHRPPGPINAMPILVLTVIAEELVWRGELVAWLQKRLTVVGTLAISTISYAVPIALSNSPLLVSFAICLGMLFTLQRIILRTWLAPLVAHLVWALLVLVAHPLG